MNSLFLTDHLIGYINYKTMITEINVQTGQITEREMTAEEIAQMEAIQNEPIVIDYGFEVDRLIRQRYDISQELAVQRQRNEKPDEFAEYNEYCEWCKSEIKRIYNL